MTRRRWPSSPRIARVRGLPVHMDGARFANAVAHLGCTPAELTWKAGVDVLSFGGTKNGCLGVEAVVLFDPARAWEFELRRKRGGHLFSKHRFLSAQMEAYLEGDLWLDLAEAANARARELAEGIAALPGSEIVHPTEANAVFASWPRAGHRAAMAAGAQYYLWPATRASRGRTRSRCRRGWSATGRRPRPRWRVPRRRSATDVAAAPKRDSRLQVTDKSVQTRRSGRVR